MNSDPEACPSALSQNSNGYNVLTVWGLIPPVGFGDRCAFLPNASKPKGRVTNSLPKLPVHHPRRSPKIDESLLAVLDFILTLW